MIPAAASGQSLEGRGAAGGGHGPVGAPCAARADAPVVQLRHLDAVWFQVAGTICNLRCRHCFISCSPENDTFGFMTVEQVQAALDEARAAGVREYYFTGGEPFAHPRMVEILERTMAYGPATVLTNGTLFTPEQVRRLRAIEDASIYSLELRVSLDGYDPATNDPIRGAGTFGQIMRGIALLAAEGFLPIITVTRTWQEDDAEVLLRFKAALRAAGYARPRIKVLPALKIGAEAHRDRGYVDDEIVTPTMMAGFDEGQLLCSGARVVTDRGVWVCPILLDAPEARVGATLADAAQAYPLRHHACFTCWQHGAICSNPASARAVGDSM